MSRPRIKAKVADMERDVWDSEDVAAYLGCSEKTVLRHVASGSLPSFRVGSLIRFHRAELLGSLAKKGGQDGSRPSAA